MKGLLSAPDEDDPNADKDLKERFARVSEKRIQDALKQANPASSERRALGVFRKLNPKRYYAKEFMSNLHEDQHEQVRCLIEFLNGADIIMRIEFLH